MVFGLPTNVAIIIVLVLIGCLIIGALAKKYPFIAGIVRDFREIISGK